jgi:hypothetical protein
MDQGILVKSDLDIGHDLILGLERVGIPISAAFWLQDDEDGRWQLVLASPLTESQDVRSIYREIWKVLSGLPSASGLTSDELADYRINVVGPHASLIREIKNKVRTGDELQEIRLDELHMAGRKYRSSRIYRVAGGKIDHGARVRVKSSGRLGTVRGLIKDGGEPRYLVVYELTPDDLKRVGVDLHPPIGDELPADDLELLYVGRVGRWPKTLPRVMRLAS